MTDAQRRILADAGIVIDGDADADSAYRVAPVILAAVLSRWARSDADSESEPDVWDEVAYWIWERHPDVFAANGHAWILLFEVDRYHAEKSPL
jgi:hypothetical protein